MTKEECIADLKSINATGMECIDYAIKALEQRPSDDVMAIHTQGLNEGIRCAMCTNSMKSDKGCDGGCVVDNKMYKKVMETIKSQMFKQPTSDDCVSRQATLDAIIKELGIRNESYLLECERPIYNVVKDMPPVIPTRKVGKWIKTGGSFRCSECMSMPEFRDIRRLKYCPNCGAEMRGSENG